MSEQIESKGKVDPIDSLVGKRLKLRRMMLGLSQHDLGHAVSVSIQQIQKYEKATNRISSGRLWVFANLLDVPVSYFYEGVEAIDAPYIHNAAFDDIKNFEFTENVPERELLTLIHSYCEISDVSVRKKIHDLVKALSSTEQNFK